MTLSQRQKEGCCQLAGGGRTGHLIPDSLHEMERMDGSGSSKIGLQPTWKSYRGRSRGCLREKNPVRSAVDWPMQSISTTLVGCARAISTAEEHQSTTEAPLRLQV